MTTGAAGTNPLLASPAGVYHLLKGMNGVAYLTERAGTILAVGETSWEHIADHADAKPAVAVVGLCLFDGIFGAEVQAASRAMHEAVWRRRHPRTDYTYRCDAPAVERLMRMSISAITMDDVVVAILYQSQILHELTRLPLDLFSKDRLMTDQSGYRPDEIVHLCSYCHDVAWPLGADRDNREWIRPEQYYARGGTTDFVVSHAICPPCVVRVVEPNI